MGKLAPLQGVPVRVGGGKLDVGIGDGVPVTRKVLPHGQEAGGRDPPGGGPAVAGGVIGVRAERAVADDRVLRVGPQVQDRADLDVRPRRRDLPGHRPEDGFGQAGVVRGAQTPLGGEVRERLGQPVDPPALVIKKDERGSAGLAGEFRDVIAKLPELPGRAGVSGEEDDPRRANLLNQRALRVGNGLPRQTHDDQAPDPVFHLQALSFGLSAPERRAAARPPNPAPSPPGAPIP